MTDDVNVVLSVTEKGFDTVLRDVEALRSELQDLGVDMSGVEKRLGSIESTAARSSRSIRDTAQATRDASRATREEINGLKERLRTIKASSTAEYELNRARKQRASANAAADWDAEFTSLTKVADAQDRLASPSVRYALYDVSNAYKLMGATMAGAAIYATVVAAQFESAFTNVARTMDPAFSSVESNVQGVRNSLVQLSGQIPLTFQELASIATIGNQMGIAEENMIGFTSTIARFASVAGVSIDETTKSFGGFMAQTGLSAEYLENLGSAMALVSINSNATEAQIISLVREITGGAVSAGFAADEIVGLAGAFASLQVAPERARGVLDTYFNRLNEAIAEGGDRLQVFSQITGKSAEELERLVRAGEGKEVFESVITGLRAAAKDGVDLTAALDAMGLSGLRAGNTFTRFVNNLSVAESSFANARQGFIEGAELNRQYAQTIDDLSSQWTIFINGLNALVDAVSGGAIPTLASLLTVINNVIFGLTEWLGDNRWAVYIGAFVTGVLGIFGAMLAFRGLLLAGTAAILAMRTAMAQMGATALASAGTVRGFAGALLGLRSSAIGAAGGVNGLRIAIRGLLASTGIGILVTLLGMGADALIGTGTYAEDAALSMEQYAEATRLGGAASEDAAGGASGLADSLGGTGKAAEETAKKVRTLADYVSDLNGVFRRSSDIRFGSAAAMDEIMLKWITMNEEVQKYQSEIRSLTADRKLKQYWLDIANTFNDQVRASQLREDIAEIDDKLAEAQAGASTELTGNSKAAIENRKAMRDLLGSYENYVSALSAAGVGQAQIQKIISNLNGDFLTQAQRLGYSGNELGTYSKRFGDLSKIIDRVPRDITVAFNPNPALQALNEFFAKAEEGARQAGADAGDAYGDGFGGGIGDGFANMPRTLGQAQGRGVAKNWWDEFLNFLDQVFVDFPTTVGEWVGSAWDTVMAEGGRQAEALWTGFTTWLDQVFGGFPGFIDNLLRPAAAKAREGGIAAGSNYAGGVTNGTRNGLAAENPVDNWIAKVNGTAWSNGKAVGSNIAGGIMAGLRNSLNANGTINYGAIKAPAGIRRPGYAGGGYTGPGHWLKPAGIVHAGEYVVPKKHVDQRTGLPDPNYVANLQRGRSAPKVGYATGGFVGGGGFGGPIELGPVSLSAIARALSVRLNVGSAELARAVSAGDRENAWAGSN